MKHAEESPHDVTHGAHEERDISVRPVVAALVGTCTLIAAIFLFLWFVTSYYGQHEAEISAPANPLAAKYGRQVPPEPRLQIHPVQDLHDVRAREEAVLNSYAWVDEKNGVVRLPIARAMELIAQRGLPARAAKESEQ